ncbi:hypothetical protein ACFQ6U_24930 [Streptomyces sp. NPDC056465]|uniref:hypothetical protein n=1 Tax=Streptomyces sp. NPDC056465 TaxID=3345829 RepID=UPI003693A757
MRVPEDPLHVGQPERWITDHAGSGAVPEVLKSPVRTDSDVHPLEHAMGAVPGQRLKRTPQRPPHRLCPASRHQPVQLLLVKPQPHERICRRHLLPCLGVYCDLISCFQRAGLICNPSAIVLGQPGLGKSSLIRRMCLGRAGYGVQPLIFGDLKPDFVDLIRALGGQVITLGRGRGYLNILDPGKRRSAAARLTGDARRALLADAHGRRLNAVSAAPARPPRRAARPSGASPPDL